MSMRDGVIRTGAPFFVPNVPVEGWAAKQKDWRSPFMIKAETNGLAGLYLHCNSVVCHRPDYIHEVPIWRRAVWPQLARARLESRGRLSTCQASAQTIRRQRDQQPIAIRCLSSRKCTSRRSWTRLTRRLTCISCYRNAGSDRACCQSASDAILESALVK